MHRPENTATVMGSTHIVEDHTAFLGDFGEETATSTATNKLNRMTECMHMTCHAKSGTVPIHVFEEEEDTDVDKANKTEGMDHAEGSVKSTCRLEEEEESKSNKDLGDFKKKKCFKGL